MKAFVTGGTGFIGQSLVGKLLGRGYDVTVLARSSTGAGRLAAMGATIVRGDITDAASMRDGMAGSDIVFHLAGWYRVGAADWHRAEPINVGGTRKVLRLAHELGIDKIVHVSTVTVFGDTGGELVDETYRAGGPFLSEYDRTKWLAHYQVAEPMIERGAPVVIAMPGGVYGPGDTSIIGQLMEMFYKGQLPALPGPDTTFTYAHVDDVAEGIILVGERGETGESYVLAGPAIPLQEMVDFWAQLTGRPAPLLRIPAQLIRPFAPLVGPFAAWLPSLYSQEAIAALGVTYAARSDKARAQLGWRTRSLQAGMSETFAYLAATLDGGVQPAAADDRRQTAVLALSTAAVLFLLWLIGRRNGGSAE